jgi:hypothetical protein
VSVEQTDSPSPYNPFNYEEPIVVVPALNYDVTVPVVRGTYKNSIEFPIYIETEDTSGANKGDKLKFPDLASELEPLQDESRRESFGGLDELQSHLSFDLETDARETLTLSRVLSEAEKKLYRNLLNVKTKTFSPEERGASIHRYRQKKVSRKMTYQIRYKVRQDLAVKRLRNKGKFIKSKKLDIRAVADMIMKSEQETLARQNSERSK